MQKDQKHAVLIRRGEIGTLQDVFKFKNIKDHKMLRMSNDQDTILKSYERSFGRPLTRLDAIVISRFTSKEIKDFLNMALYDDAFNKKLWEFRDKRTEEGIAHYNEQYAGNDPI